MNRVLWVAVVLAGAVAGCGPRNTETSSSSSSGGGSSSSSSSSSSSGGTTCVPGLQVACACGGGVEGFQVCSPAGTYGACQCPSASSGTSSMAGSSSGGISGSAATSGPSPSSLEASSGHASSASAQVSSGQSGASSSSAISSSAGGSSGGGSSSGGTGPCAPVGDRCQDCQTSTLCPQITECHADLVCRECLLGNCPVSNALFDALVAAAQGICVVECSPPNTCNPVTGVPCVLGESCQYYSGYACAPPPANVALCAPCDLASTCSNGNGCFNGQCARHCCDNADCGPTGECVPAAAGAGFCTTPGSTPAAADCSVPLTSPSGGSCVTVVPFEPCAANGNQCHDCQVTAACAQFTECHADLACHGCQLGNCPVPSPLYDALLAAVGTTCDVVCAPPVNACNPVTNAPCMGGDACDVAARGTYACYPPPSDVPLCGACDQLGAFCVPGTTCRNGECVRFCCDNTDCGPTGECTAPTGPNTAGHCLKVGSVPPSADCQAPPVSVSGGSCVTVP